MPTVCSSAHRPWRWKKCWCARCRRGNLYEETRQREHVSLTPELRSTAQTMADEMNRLFARGYTPKSKPGKHCNACSLKELCLPALYQQADPAAYLREHIEEGAP